MQELWQYRGQYFIFLSSNFYFLIKGKLHIAKSAIFQGLLSCGCEIRNYRGFLSCGCETRNYRGFFELRISKPAILWGLLSCGFRNPQFENHKLGYILFLFRTLTMTAASNATSMGMENSS